MHGQVGEGQHRGEKGVGDQAAEEEEGDEKALTVMVHSDEFRQASTA